MKLKIKPEITLSGQHLKRWEKYKQVNSFLNVSDSLLAQALIENGLYAWQAHHRAEEWKHKRIERKMQ